MGFDSRVLVAEGPFGLGMDVVVLVAAVVPAVVLERLAGVVVA
jgi:hypothetical protein